MKSLQGRMLVAMGTVIAICWAISIAVVVAYHLQTQMSVSDNQMLTLGTRVLLTIPSAKFLSETKPSESNVGADLRLRDPTFVPNKKLTFQVWIDRKRLAARAPDAPAKPLRADFADGFVSRVVEGTAWRVFSVSDATGRICVQVGTLQTEITSEVRTKILVTTAVATSILALVGVVMWCVARRSLRPVAVIQSAVGRRQKFDLTPLPEVALPAELQPLITSFNRLLKQLDEAIEGERRFIGDAAHELRTPLSALQAHTEVALRATSLVEKDIALGKLLAVVRRSTRLSEQLLDLARLGAGEHSPRREQADLGELVVHVAREFDIHAEQSRRSLILSTAFCCISCDVDEIGILLRNLIDNALRYSREGGRVQIGCRPVMRSGEPLVCLNVSDDGPGVPPSERDAIFTRFYRVAGNQARGSGIGLSLVASIAISHGATIETDTTQDARGLTVRVWFPLANGNGLINPTGDAGRHQRVGSAAGSAIPLRTSF